MILSKSQIVYNISTEISDNSTGQISPYDIRHNLLDIIDSVHVLLDGHKINTINFASLDTRSTRGGDFALENVSLTDAINQDNTAFGYSALKANYQGINNTAVGSYALSCNVHGENNIAVGHNALAGNSTGFMNVAIGNYALQGNKWGSGNIAIGHGAGYYIDRHTNNKLYVASHPIDSTYICDNPLGSGLTPLVYGDFLSNQFGIGVNSLHNDAALQVSGSIGPSHDASFDLGSQSYSFNRLYLASGINFPSGNIDYSYSLSGIAVSENIIPLEHDTYNLGTLTNRWAVGYFDQVVANIYTVSETCKYVCKTIYLASSGECEPESPCGYLSDIELENAGFQMQSSDDDRIYKFAFRPSGYYDDTCFESYNIYDQSHWNSNISLHIDSGCHIKSDRLVGSGHLSLSIQPDCFGLFLRENNTFLSREENVVASSDLAGIGTVNFLSKPGSLDDYIVTYGGLEPGTDIAQRFVSNIKTKDGNKLEGFEIKYFDDTDTNYVFNDYESSDRLVIRSFDETEDSANTIILMRSSGSTFGINNFDTGGHTLLPKTICNIRSQNDAVLRVTSEIQGNYVSSLELLGSENCLNSGVAFTYRNNSGVADISVYNNFEKSTPLTFQFNSDLGDHNLGIFCDGGNLIRDSITIGDQNRQRTVLCIRETSNGITIDGDAHYGKIWTQEKIVGDTQSSTLYFTDSNGNVFDLITNTNDADGSLLFTDDYGNTLAGIGSNFNRSVLDDFGATFNTAFGYEALNNLTSGDRNIAIGSYAADSVAHGVNNIAIGFGSMSNSNGGVSNNIVIGNSYLGRNLTTSNTLLIGNITPIISGDLRSTHRHLFIPNGKLELQNSDNTEGLLLQNNLIEIKDTGGDDYPQNQLTFRFTGNYSKDLLILSVKNTVPLVPPLIPNPTPTYEFANSGIPYAQLNGDLRLRNAIRFSDNTSLYSASQIAFASGLAIENNNRLDSLIVEGIAQEKILPGDFNTPSSGIIQLRGGSNIFVSNRDKYLEIHPRDFVIALKINNEYRPLWVSSEVTACQCCGK
jgi:predicted DNA binding protein